MYRSGALCDQSLRPRRAIRTKNTYNDCNYRYTLCPCLLLVCCLVVSLVVVSILALPLPSQLHDNNNPILKPTIFPLSFFRQRNVKEKSKFRPAVTHFYCTLTNFSGKWHTVKDFWGSPIIPQTRIQESFKQKIQEHEMLYFLSNI